MKTLDAQLGKHIKHSQMLIALQTIPVLIPLSALKVGRFRHSDDVHRIVLDILLLIGRPKMRFS